MSSMSCTQCFRRAGGYAGVMNYPRQRDIGIYSLRTTAQHDGVAGLKAEAGNVHRYVGTRFIDGANHAEGYLYPPHRNPTLDRAHFCHFTHRVFQGSHLAHVAGYACQHFR